MSPEITPEYAARALYEEMNPRFERRQALPELERVSGRLRVRTPLQSMTWRFPARATATHEHVCLNVGLTVVEWGLPGPMADELGAKAGALSMAADALPGARQAVTVALDDTRIILGVVSLTGLQDAIEVEEPQDPGVVEAVQALSTASGVLNLAVGPGLFTVVELPERAPRL
jgi:hypothetical protein